MALDLRCSSDTHLHTTLNNDEKNYLAEAYRKVIEWLRLDSAESRMPETIRWMAIQRMQAFLYLYLRRAGLAIFRQSFIDDKAVFRFFRLFIGQSRRLRANPDPSALSADHLDCILGDDTFLQMDNQMINQMTETLLSELFSLPDLKQLMSCPDLSSEAFQSIYPDYSVSERRMEPPSSPSSNASDHPLPEYFRTARQELMARLHPVLKEKSMKMVAKSSIAVLTKADADGDTPLMVACANPAYRYEDLYALLERLKSHPHASAFFTAVNHRRETALYLAAWQRRALMTGYLAETMTSLSIPLDQTYDDKGNSIIHCVAIWGDHYSHVLEYLIRIATSGASGAFDLNATNHRGRTALHEAVLLFRPDCHPQHSVINNIQLLLDYGADAGLPCGVWGNAPLHSTAALCDVSDAQQMALIELLLDYGADPMQRNNVQQLPFDLVPPHRHQAKMLLMTPARRNT